MEFITQATVTERFTLFGYRNRFILFLVTVFVFLAAFFKIADLDFWWHLKTGQLIWQQKTFQYQEIYSHTANGNEYIDHEWLFQVWAYLSYAAAGPAGVIFLKCAVLVSLYVILTRFLLKQGHPPGLVLAVVTLSIVGARTRFIERPEIFSALFLVTLYLLLENYLRTQAGERKLFLVPVLMIIWANTHAAVILGFVLMAAFLAGFVLEQLLAGQGAKVFYHREKPVRTAAVLVAVGVVSFLATLINPYGLRVLTVPFELTAIIDSSLLNNQEWQQPPIQRLPFFYISLLFALSLPVVYFRKVHVTNFLLTAFFGYISLKYVRNVGLFCMMMPLLVEPYLGSITAKRMPQSLYGAFSAVMVVALVYTSPFEFGIGVASYFPERIVRYTEKNKLQGRMLNSYAFGGYLIWRLYPEKRIFIDGRNEVFLPLLQEITEAREDSRKWKKVLAKYQVEYALLNYVDELERLTIVDEENNAVVTYAPFSSTHFPRTEWALVYWDDDGMIFVRRSGPNGHLTANEYQWVFPEGANYQQQLIRSGKIPAEAAVRELERKLHEDPDCTRARILLNASRQFLAQASSQPD